MKYLFCKENTTFYPVYMRSTYENAGTWPTQGVEVGEDVFNKYAGQAPIGKQRGADDKGYPTWVAIPPPPPPTKAQCVTQAEQQKAQGLEAAAKALAPLQDAEDLGMATAEEKAALIAWKTYRVQLNRITPQDAPDIEWPHTPDA